MPETEMLVPRFTSVITIKLLPIRFRTSKTGMKSVNMNKWYVNNRTNASLKSYIRFSAILTIGSAKPVTAIITSA
jgi:hypothetical protein